MKLFIAFLILTTIVFVAPIGLMLLNKEHMETQCIEAGGYPITDLLGFYETCVAQNG